MKFRHIEKADIIGIEALIRWEMKGRELLPGKFIELAEQYGMIHAISDWVIKKACQDCKQLHDLGYEHQPFQGA